MANFENSRRTFSAVALIPADSLVKLTAAGVQPCGATRLGWLCRMSRVWCCCRVGCQVTGVHLRRHWRALPAGRFTSSLSTSPQAAWG